MVAQRIKGQLTGDFLAIEYPSQGGDSNLWIAKPVAGRIEYKREFLGKQLAIERRKEWRKAVGLYSTQAGLCPLDLLLQLLRVADHSRPVIS